MAEQQAPQGAGEESATAALLKSKEKSKEKQKHTNTSDVLLSSAQQIENLSKDDAISMTEKLIDERGANDFRIGGLLSAIQTNGWFEGYASFKDMVREKFGMEYRKAMYLIGTYTNLVQHQVPWDKVKHLGWTKLSLMAHILTPANVDEWVKKAEALNCLQLAEAVKQFTNSGGQAENGEEVTSTVSTMTFKVHADQKEVVREALDKAKAETQTEFDTVALANICTAYLGGNIEVKMEAGTSLIELLKKHGSSAVLEAFDQAFPEVNIQVEA